jgi:Phasin protein
MAKDNIADWNITLDQLSEQIADEVRGSVDKYLSFLQQNLQKAVSSYPLVGTDLGEIVKASTEKNISIARDYINKLSQAKDLMAAIPIQTEFMQSQLASFGEQIKSLGEAHAKVATDVLKTPVAPAQTDFMQTQLAAFGDQIRSLGETYTKAATDMLNKPLGKVG